MISARKIPRNTQRSRTVSLAAPIGGWNARDALGEMDPLDAVTLQNFWPGTSSVLLRNGYSSHVTGITGQVESLMTYSSSSTNTMFGAAGTSVYNVTSPGAVGAAVLTGMANARWQHINFTTTGGSYLLMVNGADKIQVWDGTNWHKDGDGAPYDITNVNSAACVNILAFKNRVWLIENTSLKAWYLPINAIGGAAASLDMSSVAQMGGYLVAAMPWTIDAGYGVDDYLAFITSNGEVLVWRLTDPTAPSGIALIGIWNIGSPVGRRCWTKYAGDLLIISQDGVLPMSSALQSSRLNPKVSLTDKIQFAMSTATATYKNNFGWQLQLYPKGNQLYLNVPVAEGSLQQQYVQNNITKAWCNFTGWSANCWELLGDDPYFGGNGVVNKAWTGTTDNGSNIQAFGLQAFNQFKSSSQKQCKMVRFHLRSDGTPNLYGNVNVDFNLNDNSAQLITGGSTGTAGIWGTSKWDEAVWGGDMAASAFWQGATGIGYSFAPLLKTGTSGVQVQWMSTDLVFETGGTL